MAISFNNVPANIRTPGAYLEIDNSRALKGLVQNPHKVLILGQKLAAGSSGFDTLTAITRDNLADGYFGAGSILARMCNAFKNNNPNTELFAMALGSGIAGTAAAGAIDFSAHMDGNLASGTGTYYLMINGVEIQETITSGMSGGAIASMYASAINALSAYLPVTAKPSMVATSMGHLAISAVNSGTLGNYINIRENYYAGQSLPTTFSTNITLSAIISGMENGATDPDLGDAWAVIDNEQFHYIIQPYTDAANLTEIEDELADRFLPLEDLQGHGFTCYRNTVANCTTLGNTRNNPHNTIVGIYDSPTGPEEIAAAWGAVAAWNLNNDPARPLHFLSLKGVLPPPIENRFTRAERDTLLYDGIATYIVDAGGKVLIERSITTYQTNAVGTADPSYLDIQTLATLGEIRYQYKARMTQRFLIPRFKLADDTFPVQPGQKIATPKTVKAETIALFTLLRNIGLVENLDEFISNLIVERNLTDRNRIDVLIPADLVNQFRILAGNIQFIL
jgi:phage tail sheath gpL-like